MARSEKEKKQLMIVGTLFAVMLGVGAFSFLGGGKPAPAAKVAKETSEPVENRDYADESGVKEGIRQYAGPEFVERDPFGVPGALKDLAANTSPTTPAAQPINRVRPNGPTPTSAGNTSPLQPEMPAMEGNLQPTATLTTDTGQQKPEPTEWKPTPDDPGLSVVGVVKGDVPTAILQDHGGKQFLLKLGSEANDARLIAVANRHVVIEYGGKKHILHLAR